MSLGESLLIWIVKNNSYASPLLSRVCKGRVGQIIVLWGMIAIYLIEFLQIQKTDC